MSKKSIACACIWIVLSIFSTKSNAQCLNTVQPSCGVYQNCFSKLCSCSTSRYEYFSSYGKKYCEVFLDLGTLSVQGKSWRDGTLKCLQEKIVPMLPPDGKADTCDCQKTEGYAFDTHVACYTPSICSLPPEDWTKIFVAAGGVKTIVDSKSRKQIVEVAKICLPKVGGSMKARLTQFIKDMQ
jgi:hypothetical protein